MQLGGEGTCDIMLRKPKSVSSQQQDTKEEVNAYKFVEDTPLVLFRSHFIWHVAVYLMFTFSTTIMSGCGWVMVLDNRSRVIRQENDTFFEVAQEEGQVASHFHDEGVKAGPLS